eukprot:CAMPEP_0206484420 /NCGR_PEP_ID=MMETSP0324_2-20121206/39968_1 /ASSEMBLY_ACC=CAM_ASM_000836 /TAXON_ID=2866 /ORGANISM="Crypthecodinium cohnii, Strain Seligo" /LENGTH=557 /DNA_ID=CAMNT_0053962573 /DNA_START=223 /DNA_END=1896 /DNA_ORIENTATION=-
MMRFSAYGLIAGALMTSDFTARGVEAAGPAVRGDAVARSERNTASLLSALQVTEYSGEERRSKIEMKLGAAFQSVPKNDFGRIESKAVRYLLQLYFEQEHGWQLGGLEPHGFLEDLSELHDIALLRDQAPELARVMESSGHHRHGASLREVAALAATVERLVLDQSVNLLQVSYAQNGLDVGKPITEKELHEVLKTQLMLFEHSTQVFESFSIPKNGTNFVEVAEEQGFVVDHIALFEEDAVKNGAWRSRDRTNPFRPPEYRFEEASGLVDDLISVYGRWQNEECIQMSDQLKSHSRDGQVTLEDFFSQHMHDLGFEFSESLEYLEQSGALDVNSKTIRMSNYLMGPSNCIAASPYFAICCLSECNGITQQIMAGVQGPEGTPEQLLSLIANISTRYIEAPRVLPKKLRQDLQALASNFDGVIPLHSRSFALWVHQAFPEECPYPHIVSDKKHLAASYWKDALATTVQSREERVDRAKQFIQEETPAAMKTNPLPQQEVLYLHERKQTSSMAELVHAVPAILLLLVVGRFLMELTKGSYTALAGAAKKRQQTTLPLP